MNSLFVFDVDETLFKTNATVKVLDGGWVVRSLSNSEFNTYKLEQNQQFDFNEFINARLFYNEAIPIDPMLTRVKEIYRYKDRSDKIIILTAREDMDQRDLYLKKFIDNGIKINGIHIYRAGNNKASIKVADKKALVIRNHIEKYYFNKIYFFDDSHDNLKVFLDLKTDYPDIEFYAWSVTENGNVELYK